MDPFRFFTKLDQPILLGKKARNVSELYEGIMTVPPSSIYYHTHRFLQQHHYLSPEPPNDFAYWVTGMLNDALLGERLWSIDTIQFHNIGDLRERLAGILKQYGSKTSNKRIQCPEGHEFHFIACRTFALPTRYTASTLGEFRDILEKITIASLYFHIFDAKLRLENNENDFSRWFRDLGKPALADEVMRLDPYTQTLEGLRKRLLHLAERHDKN